jgi:TrpR-related protein YerC/YecD
MSIKKLGFQFNKDSKSLFTAILSLKTNKECEKFFRDLCTLSELKSMTERWVIVRYLTEGLSYRKIAERTGASTATVTRVAFWMENGEGGYNLALTRKK